MFAPTGRSAMTNGWRRVMKSTSRESVFPRRRTLSWIEHDGFRDAWDEGAAVPAETGAATRGSPVQLPTPFHACGAALQISVRRWMPAREEAVGGGRVVAYE